jgi:dolichol-phosphate mannosyltransferase
MLFNSSKKVTIILPTYNEAKNVVGLIGSIFAVAATGGHAFKVLIVDDNSPDGTAEVVRELQKSNPDIELLMGKKEGLGRAYLRGFRYVIDHMETDVVVMMDADYSHDPNAIPRMVEKVGEGADYVIGSRYVADASIPGNWPLLRILNSRVANFVATNVAGIDAQVRDISGGFKAIKMEALKCIELDKIVTRGYGFQMHLLYEFQKCGYKIVEVPTTFRERKMGNSKMSLNDILGFLRCAYGLNPNSPVRTLTRFLSVGIAGAFVNLIALYLLSQYAPAPSVWNSALATEVSIVFNFFMHTLFTFRETELRQRGFGKTLHKLLTYNVASAGTAVLTVAVFSLLNVYMGVYYLTAQLSAIGIAFLLNYWMSSKVIWKKHATT